MTRGVVSDVDDRGDLGVSSSHAGAVPWAARASSAQGVGQRVQGGHGIGVSLTGTGVAFTVDHQIGAHRNIDDVNLIACCVVRPVSLFQVDVERR